jgi:hypothetical protein
MPSPGEKNVVKKQEERCKENDAAVFVSERRQSLLHAAVPVSAR